jgi:hypothetical protein
MRVRPPFTVIAYALVREGAHEGLVFGGSVWALATLGLWRSGWIAWLFLVIVVSAGGLAVVLIRWPSSLYVACAVLLHGTLLALLLSRPTWRYTRRGRPRFLASFSPTPPE